MNVRILIVCIFLVFGVISAKKVKTKGENYEDVYGEIEDAANDGDVQNDDDYGTDAGDTDQDPNEIIRNEDYNVEILTKPETFVAKIGDTVWLPCNVSVAVTDGVYIWHKDSTLLYQGEYALNKSENIVKLENGTLKVRLTSDNDFGNYVCQFLVSNSQHPSINHTIVKLSPPEIISILPDKNQTVYKVGDTMTLTCRAKGYPVPEISWHRENGERLSATGETLTITDLKWRHGGTYRCLADNKLTSVAHKFIQIYVEHPPMITTEKYFVNSDHQSDAELTCTVHAYPSPSIVWRKEGENVVQTNRIELSQKKHVTRTENILVIHNLTEKDFGKYSCFAKNSLGKNEKTVSLVKTPAIREFIKPEKSNVVLTWKVDSKAPILEHELQFKKKGESEWTVIKPKVTEGNNGAYEVKHPLPGLEPGSYETRVRSRNSHGWSDFSDVMPFEGVSAKPGSAHKNHHKKHHKAKDTQSERNASTTQGTPSETHDEHVLSAPSKTAPGSGSSRLIVAPIIMSLVILLCFHNRQ